MAISKTSFALGLLNPNQPSAQSLSTGTYSLSARSNIPFARLIGKGIDKIFTWGETVEVPQGMMCRVTNASFHAGDLFINSGCDLDNKPARITIPAMFSLARNISGIDYIAPTYGVDVRAARRAYVALDAMADFLGSQVAIIGQKYDGSHNTSDEANNQGFEGAGYANFFQLINEGLGLIPLGQNANLGDDTRPHALLTVAWAYFQNNIDLNFVNPANAYYVVEY